MIPERSNIAKSAKSVFFEDVNDIDIYIEDTAIGYEKLFSIIFSRLFKDEYKVAKVFPVGSRRSVIEQHELHFSSGRPSLYVIDGDLYFLTGNDVENKLGLYKLPMYCIENLLCDCEAIFDVLDEEEPVNKREFVAECFDYEKWVFYNRKWLFELFVEYAISFQENPSLQTVSHPVNRLVSSSEGDLSKEKIENRIDSIRCNSVEAIGVDEYEEVRKRLIERCDKIGGDKLRFVSGKDYVFPLLKMRARNIVKTKISDINLKQRIARRCDLGDLFGAKRFVMR